LGIYIDITTEKKIQEELAKQIDETEQANYSTIRFISTASHEIRNPMTNVLALQNGIKEKLDVLQDFFYKMIKLLNDKSETEFSNKIAETFHEMHELAYLCNSEANRTLTALQNLGDLHHMQSEGIKTNFVFIGLDEFIKKSISNSTYPNTKNLEVDIHISETIPKEVIIDYANLCAALSVLIGNAIRFSRINQRIKIEVTTMQQESNSYLTITVQDYGVGMPEEQVKRLFTALNKEGKHTRDALYHKPSVQLLRAKMWIEASGGKLELTSVVNQGTTASITVPYSVADSEKIANFSPKIKKAIESPNSSFQPYILLIEDDNISQKSTYTALIEAGYKVDVASDGAEAIRLALKNDYDVAILDISLPDMNGVEVMHQIRAIKQDQIIFIAFTSHASEEDEDYFIEAGVMAVLAKPATISQLQNLIEEAIKVKIRLNQEKK
ncbi:MAG TPA: response regulator, partial [Gammaproteobacteria bacterium]|nr:response regulator [Gammaproteobacteria bacterium]